MRRRKASLLHSPHERAQRGLGSPSNRLHARLCDRDLPGMVGLFDIFKLVQNGEPVWLEAAQNLESATARVQLLQQQSPGDYMIYSHKTGKKIVFNARGGIKRD